MKWLSEIEPNRFFLWIFVTLAALVLGGGLYELRVVIPLWAHAPPESVWTFAQLRNSQPAFTPNAGIRFWIFLTPAHESGDSFRSPRSGLNDNSPALQLGIQLATNQSPRSGRQMYA